MVDDNHINRLFFESSLRKLGHEVQSATDGYAALSVCESKTFDLILMDIRMVGMDGIQTAEAIKKLTNHHDTTILAISAEPIDCDAVDVFTDCLLKPISQVELEKAINHYLNDPSDFDHQQALAVAHDDEAVVQQLRAAFIQQLPDDWNHIERCFKAGDEAGLQHALHQLLGAAKMCGAVGITSAVADLKSKDLGQLNEHNMQPLVNLKKAIKQVLKP